jgi:hypothetical protein
LKLIWIKCNEIVLVYSVNRIESVRHNCSSKILFDRVPCQPKCISFDQKVFIIL